MTAPSRDRASRTVVALPVRDEEARLGPCLEALFGGTARPDAAIVLLNNCTDGSECIAHEAAERLPVHVIACRLPPELANAGHARTLAMRHADAMCEPHDVLLTTDADGVVAPGWLAANLAAFAAGAEAVCGRAVIDPVEALLIPAHLHEDDARETTLTRLLDEIAARIDPDPADPWPRHTEHSGASIAVRCGLYRRASGLPPRASGEDRAFVEALQRLDARLRHAPDAFVTVSGRTEGRARNGMADAIRRRIMRQDDLTDERLEPAWSAWRRVLLRARARRLWVRGGHTPPGDLAADLGMDGAVVEGLLRGPYFGAAWSALSALSPRLARRRVAFTALPAEIEAATRLLDGLRRAPAALLLDAR